MAEQQEMMEGRERDVLQFCDGLPEKFGAVVIGGYAVSALSVPRYSADMDFICPSKEEEEIRKYMVENGFSLDQERKDIEQNYGGAMACYLRKAMTIDFLFGSVVDREVKVPIPYETIRKNSALLSLRGVSGINSKPILVANREMLFALKIQPFRPKDQEDLAAISLGEISISKSVRILRPVALKCDLIAKNLERGIELAKTESFRHRMTSRFPGINKNNVNHFMNRLQNVLSAIKAELS